jgi:hypothetical protein
LILNQNGNVGIDNLTPAYPLDVTGLGRFTGGIYTSGYVGIGTTSPKCPLDVESSAGITIVNYELLNSAAVSGYSGGAASTPAVGLYVAQRIITGSEVDVTSDARVKEIVGRSNPKNDLATICKLKITDYRKIDKVQYGSQVQKGVIAQEVQAVIPEAVNTSTNFIPNIYALAHSFGCTNGVLEVTMAKPHGLVVGDLVELITEAGELQLRVSAVNTPLHFTVDKMDKTPKQLFVYGKQVGDLHEVNYDRLFTTGLGAIQELAKRADAAEARADRLSKCVDELTLRAGRLADLESKAAQVDGLAKDVADLKKLVAQLAEAAKNSKLAGAADASGKLLTTASLSR